MRYHSSSAPARPWLLGLCLSLALSLLPVRAVPFSVNLLGDYQGTFRDGESLPLNVEGSQLLYGIEMSGASGSSWRESGNGDLFTTTFAVGNLIASVELTAEERPELTYLALQAGDRYSVWDIHDWNSWHSDTLLVVNDHITSIHRIRVPFLGTLRIRLPDDITGIALYGPLVTESPGSDGDGDAGGGIVLGGDVGSHPTRVPDGGSVFALLAVGVAAAAFMTRRAS